MTKKCIHCEGLDFDPLHRGGEFIQEEWCNIKKDHIKLDEQRNCKVFIARKKVN